MPQKRNPDAAELMRAAAPRVAADLQGLLATLHGLPLAYNTDLREDKRYLFDAVDCLDALLPVVRRAARRPATSTPARMAAACDSFLMATDVADELVARGLPFREAHHVTGALVRRCLELGCELGELPLAELAALSPAAGSTGVRRRSSTPTLARRQAQRRRLGALRVRGARRAREALHA